MNILTNAIDALIEQAVREMYSQEFKGGMPAADAIQKPRIEITTKVFSRTLLILIRESAIFAGFLF
jgi:hypothetical protein